MSRGEIEPIAGIIRIFGDGRGHSEPFDWTATVRYIDRTTAELCNAMKAPTPGQRRAIMQTLAAAGITRLKVTRYHNGRPTIRHYSTSPKDTKNGRRPIG